MKARLVLAVMLTASLTERGAAREPVPPFESNASLAPQGKIDDLVFGRLKRLGIPPAPLCSDAVFVRRVYLDAIGTLPTAQEAKDFLADRDPKKRGKLIDRLLERTEFADYWAVKWSDLLRVKSEYPINLWPNAVQGYHRWIRTCIKQNVPYDRFVRELLTASGSNFNVPQVNFYRALQSREPAAVAQAVALNFMGVRPDTWPKERWDAMAVFFSRIEYKATEQWKEEIVQLAPAKDAAKPAEKSAAEAEIANAQFPDGTPTRLLPDQDPREIFANWLISPKNPYFTRNIANRVWSWLLGRGIIHEPDDIRTDNPPSNPELLAYLERELVNNHYDLKRLFRLILNSKTYQLSSIPATDPSPKDAEFAHYLPRRLDAEVLIDALCRITGTTEQYSSPIPEPFTFIPENRRSIELADGSIGSTFLETFGRPSRDTGLESERNNRPSAAQSLHLLNSSHIRRKLEQSDKLRELLQAKKKPREIVEELYLTILSRPPTADELLVLRDYSQPVRGGRRPLLDVTWALMNSAEFLYRH
ncbi:MAG: DUF1553 domain-containing protein [Pirellulales bacterium]|nr:DUF1553 domain-containing protein [Pirellulales bacterium]